MPDQPAITAEAHIAGRSAALDALHQWNLTLPAARSTMFELIKAAAHLAVTAAAPHIATQALHDAAGDLALSTYHHECAAAVQTRLKQLAEAALAGRPGSAAPTRTELTPTPCGICHTEIRWDPDEPTGQQPHWRHVDQAASYRSASGAHHATPDAPERPDLLSVLAARLLDAVDREMDRPAAESDAQRAMGWPELEEAASDVRAYLAGYGATGSGCCGGDACADTCGTVVAASPAVLAVADALKAQVESATEQPTDNGCRCEHDGPCDCTCCRKPCSHCDGTQACGYCGNGL